MSVIIKNNEKKQFQPIMNQSNIPINFYFGMRSFIDISGIRRMQDTESHCLSLVFCKSKNEISQNKTIDVEHRSLFEIECIWLPR